MDVFFACTDNMYFRLIWLYKFLHCNNFICFLCFWRVPHLIVSWQPQRSMECVCVCVCVCVCMYLCIYVLVCTTLVTIQRLNSSRIIYAPQFTDNTSSVKYICKLLTKSIVFLIPSIPSNHKLSLIFTLKCIWLFIKIQFRNLWKQCGPYNTYPRTR